MKGKQLHQGQQVGSFTTGAFRSTELSGHL
jgi:hypothetical protein